ncbi:MAG: hypothetical protein ACRYFK_00710 [Janthinobacterium lividum]
MYQQVICPFKIQYRAKISCYLRGTTSKKVEGTVNVKFTHTRKHFERATKVHVTAREFDEETGRVKPKIARAAEYNGKIDIMRSRFQWALNRLLKDKLEPTPSNIRDAYNRLSALREPMLALAEKIAIKHQNVADSLRGDIPSLKA